MEAIAKNLDVVNEKIRAAAQRSGRGFDDIIMVAATKTVPPERINEAIAAGVTNIGENRVQEFTQKLDDIAGGVRHHFIGHLQTNKVKYLIGKTCLIHSAHTDRLMDEIERLSIAANTDTNVLIEVNASGEESKHGTGFEDVLHLIENNEKRTRVKIKGLMTIGPNYSGEEEIRNVFKQMNKLFLDISGKKYDNSIMKYLSMGMSADFEIAIEEGANMVRIGSALFGDR